MLPKHFTWQVDQMLTLALHKARVGTCETAHVLQKYLLDGKQLGQTHHLPKQRAVLPGEAFLRAGLSAMVHADLPGCQRGNTSVCEASPMKLLARFLFPASPQTTLYTAVEDPGTGRRLPMFGPTVSCHLYKKGRVPYCTLVGAGPTACCDDSAHLLNHNALLQLIQLRCGHAAQIQHHAGGRVVAVARPAAAR